jgi:hypothetical protein
LFSCDVEEDEEVRYLPVNPEELLYHKGDVLAFEIDSNNTGAVIVTGYSREAEDSTHIWYELVGTDYTAKRAPTTEQLNRLRLFGRKIASSLAPSGYYIGLDVESVRNDCLADNAGKFQTVGHVQLDATKVKQGSLGATSEYSVFVESFIRNRESRKLPPDHYDEFFKTENFRPDEYFSLTYFLAEPL